MEIELAYGRHGLTVELPDDVPVTVIEPRFVHGVPDEEAAIRAAVRSPIGTQPLHELAGPKYSVAVVFSDLTRPMPNERVLPPLLDELALTGVPDKQVALINALGTHRPQSEEELVGMLGQEIVKRYRVLQHDAWGTDLVEVTENWAESPVCVNRAYVEASVRILTGFIEPHFFAGFSGGPKAVLPGIADIDSILDNHSGHMLANPKSTWAVTKGNPVWEEMVAVAEATAPTFLLNVTLNQKREITGVFAGDMMSTHREGVAFVRKAAMQPVSHPFDVVITSNSGYPLDLNLYQAVKGMSAAAQIVRPGGDIIIAAECWDGVPEHGEYKKILGGANSVEELWETVTTPGFRRHDQWEALVQARIQRKANVHMYTDGLNQDEIRRALLTPSRSIEATIDQLVRHNPELTVAVLPDGPQTVPYVTQE